MVSPFYPAAAGDTVMYVEARRRAQGSDGGPCATLLFPPVFSEQHFLDPLYYPLTFSFKYFFDLNNKKIVKRNIPIPIAKKDKIRVKTLTAKAIPAFLYNIL
jgi:hypothetical protein